MLKNSIEAIPWNVVIRNLSVPMLVYSYVKKNRDDPPAVDLFFDEKIYLQATNNSEYSAKTKVIKKNIFSQSFILYPCEENWAMDESAKK